MGEQSPSDSDYQAASGQVEYRKTQKAREKRKQEEAMMRMAEDEDQVGLYARSQSGNIIRSASSGRGVTSSAGRQALENIRGGFDSNTKGYMKNRTTISSDDDAYAPEAERPQEPTIDPIQTADLSRAARRVAGQGQVGRGQRRFIRTI